MIKNRNGNVLPILLIIMTILGILGIAITNVSYSANREAIFSEDRVQAYFIAKSGADIVIKNINSIIQSFSDNTKKTFSIDFSEGIATIEIDIAKEDNNIKYIDVLSKGEINGSKSAIKARLLAGNNQDCEQIILGIGKDGKIYEFDKNFSSFIEKNNGINKPGLSSFAWDGKNTIVLVGDTKHKKDNSIISRDLGNSWEENPEKNGNGLDSIIWSEERGTFYATQLKDDHGSNTGHIFYLIDGIWEKMSDKPKQGFKIEKIAQGNNFLVGISKYENGKVVYKEGDNEWQNTFTKDEKYNIYGTFYSIAYGNGTFVIVGSDDGHSLIIYSKDLATWHKGKYNVPGSAFPLYDVTWTGDKFVAVGGADTIFTSKDGVNWDRFMREDIVHEKGAPYYYDLKNISSSGNYIAAYSDEGNSVLFSKDGGKSWVQKIDEKYPKLEDIIVINNDYGSSDFHTFNIQWYK